MSPATSVTVVPVQEAAAMEDFLRLPWTIYRGDPYWVPALLPHQRRYIKGFEALGAHHYKTFRVLEKII